MGEYKSSKASDSDKKDVSDAEPGTKADKKDEKMVLVEPVHGEMYDLETNTRISPNGGRGSRVPDSGYLQSQIEAGKLTIVET